MKKPSRFALGQSKMTGLGPVKLAIEDRLDRLEGMIAEQAHVIDAQTEMLQTLLEQVSEKSLQLCFVMRFIKVKRPRKVVIPGQPTFVEQTLEACYAQERERFLATLMQQVGEAQANGEGVQTEAGGSPDGKPGTEPSDDSDDSAGPRFSGPTRH